MDAGSGNRGKVQMVVRGVTVLPFCTPQWSTVSGGGEYSGAIVHKSNSRGSSSQRL